MEWLNTSVTFVITIIGGVFVFILSQLFLKIVLEPFSKYKVVKSKIAYLLVYYGNTLYPHSISTEMQEEASDCIRKLSAELTGCIQEISWYTILLFFHVIPSKIKLQEVAGSLIGLSNGILYNGPSVQQAGDNNDKRVEHIKKILHLHSI